MDAKQDTIEPVPVAQSLAPTDGKLPDPFRVRRPILVSRPVVERSGLAGKRVLLLGKGEIVDALKTKLKSKKHYSQSHLIWSSI